jgi:hypothetical protein
MMVQITTAIASKIGFIFEQVAQLSMVAQRTHLPTRR